MDVTELDQTLDNVKLKVGSGRDSVLERSLSLRLLEPCHECDPIPPIPHLQVSEFKVQVSRRADSDWLSQEQLPMG